MREADFELIDRFLQGDGTAFDELVRKRQREVYNLAYRMTRNADDARDVSQEAFLQVYRNLSRFDRRSSLSTWLYRIVVNLCLNHLNRGSRALYATVDQHPDPADLAKGSLARLEEREQADALTRAIETLPPQQRASLTLRVHHHLAHREIAEILGVSEATAKVHYFHAVQTLRRKLAHWREGA
ncbi:MAG: sigma-70 family RNA polymerase sigma factor [Candidatus Methylomirabilis oxygeniifera]|uniref:RNA polymerase, sigma-24 subunit, ECF subfamily n=1 Tax=Methylomirabilis oxygeniifera TaxID=671143 RepID=D5ML72_METO1|nr:MAG: sigma-70 family RNA polymerase sigma factor [Candidatus Methylomirabilis oxyfera]CBE69914.1 RNA polymerase, sigma-24 subunit, ECF subfamily [Candidatus Methylomirabilis oxyfera]